MASPLLVKVACLAVMSMVLGIPLANGAIPCGQVQFTVAPCIGYIRGSAGSAVPGACCNGLRNINNESKSTSDRQGVCSCLKSTVLSLPGINRENLAGLAGKCGINLPYKITPTIDCTKIN